MDGWSKKRLIEITKKIGSGATPRGGSDAYKDSGISLFRSLNIHDRTFKEKNLAFIDEDQANKLSNVEVQEGDVLLNITGASIARCCIAPSELLPARVNQHVAIIRPRSDYIDSNFLVYLLVSKQYKDALLNTGEKAGSTRQALTKQQLENFEVTIPKLPEQKRIVAILNEAFEGIDRAIANTEKNLANSRELFESHLNTIFTRENSRWKWVNLSEITTDITDGDHQPPPKSQSGIPFITISNIDKQNRKVDFSNTFKVPSEYFEKLKSNRKPRKGDLLYTVTGSYGIPVVVEHDMDFCFQRHIGLIRPSNETNSKCLYYIFLSRYLLNQADECATGTAQKTVSLSGLRRFSVPKIPREEQEAIVVELDLLAEKIYRLETIYHQKLAALNELKQSILQKAFTGELTVRLSSPTTADTPKTVKEEIAA